MKRILIIFLVCLNAGLLVVLVMGPGAPRADAQVIGGGTDYMAITGRIGAGWDAIYVIDVGKQRLASWKFDRKRKRLIQVGKRRELIKDFP